MLRSTLRYLLFLTCAFTAPAAVSAEAPRFALVIANAEYTTPADRLTGPARDADLVVKALRGAHFRVNLVRNATVAQMQAAVDSFANELKQGGPAAIGLLYYAGHGGADRNRYANYLLPVDVANIGSADYAARGYPVEAIFKRLSYLDERPAITIIIDACRSTSGGTASGGPFMVDPPDPGRGFLLAHSTGQGHAASDSSVFAEAFAKSIAQPGLTLEQALDAVRREVSAKNPAQLPNHKSGLVAKVCLGGCVDSSAARGKFANNTTLLQATQADAQRLIESLERQRAREFCADGYGTLLELHGSALAALRAGDAETAGGTWEQVLQRGNMITAVVSMIDRTSESARQLEEIRRAHDIQSARTSYERFERNFDRDELPRATKGARGPKLENDLKRMQALRAEAVQLAADSKFLEAAQKMVDAINLGRAIDQEGNNRPSPRSQVELRRSTTTSVRTVTPAEMKKMFPNSPCS